MVTNTILPQQLQAAVQAGQSVELIDVRTPAEFREIHVAFARNVPLDRLNAAQLTAEHGTSTQPLYVICRSGSRARQACERLAAAGCRQVVSVEGGTQAWDQAGLPVVRGPKAMSLERQVRIAAGSLVVLGSLLGTLVSPYGIALAAFMGAGLIYSGITDTCAIAMLLARMPWNQAPASSNGCTTACRVGALLLAAAALAPSASRAAEHTSDSLATVRRSLAEQRALLVDVREEGEWQDGHLRSARLLPLSVLKLGVRTEELARVLPADKVIYLHCAAGGRCLQAAKILLPSGYDARALSAGYDELLQAGFSAARGP